MFNRVLLAVLAAVFTVSLGIAPALAQTTPARPPARETDMNGRPVQSDPQRGRRNARPPSPAQNKTAAEGLLTATSTTCQVGEVTLRGQIADGAVYEVSCAIGPGYVLIGSTPPQAVDCVILAGQADMTRARDPEADVGLQCQIEANKDVLKVVQGYAVTAGVTCTVDQGATVGKAGNGNIIYEVGCAGTDGYWMEKTPTGWTVTECQKVITTNGKCKFTTPEEQAATVKAWFANSPASACDVTQARFMGSNANGSFYEAKCVAGDGLIARFDTAMAVQQVYPCAEAARIGGGCTLTVVPAAASAPAGPPATQR